MQIRQAAQLYRRLILSALIRQTPFTPPWHHPLKSVVNQALGIVEVEAQQSKVQRLHSIKASLETIQVQGLR